MRGILLALLAIFAIVQTSTSLWLSGKLDNSNNGFPKSFKHLLDYTSFASFWTVIVAPGLFSSLNDNGRLNTISHIILCLPLFIFWAIDAVLVTVAFKGGFDCQGSLYPYCSQWNALEAFSWIELFLITTFWIASSFGPDEDYNRDIELGKVNRGGSMGLSSRFVFACTKILIIVMSTVAVSLSAWTVTKTAFTGDGDGRELKIALYLVMGSCGWAITSAIFASVELSKAHLVVRGSWRSLRAVPVWFNSALFLGCGILLTSNLSGKLNCESSAYKTCAHLKALQAAVWMISILCILILGYAVAHGVPTPHKDETCIRPTSVTRAKVKLSTFSKKCSPVELSRPVACHIEKRAIKYSHRRSSVIIPQAPIRISETVTDGDCGICLERCSANLLVQLSPCSHTFCKTCTVYYAQSQLEQRRLPIQCPICITLDSQTDSGVFDVTTAEQLDLPERECHLIDDARLEELSNTISCPKCHNSFRVDRKDYLKVDTVNCPMPSCHHIWCKHCAQAIEFGHIGMPHSCDGTTELETLMKEKGWKFCPNCKTPHEKIAGCNHMTCSSAGCNTHYCYRCSGMIIRSTRRDETSKAVMNHRCRT